MRQISQRRAALIAAILKEVEDKLAPARRKVMVQKFATHAARRLHRLRDPDMAPNWS